MSSESSLQQLVRMGILDPDFLEHDVRVQVQHLDQPQSRVQAHPQPQAQGRFSVEYLDRPGDTPTPPPTPTPAPAPTPTASSSLSDDLASIQSAAYHWLYSSPSYGWWHFSRNDNDYLERLYQSGQQQCSLNVGQNSYMVDFRKMQQLGQGRPRHVLRLTSLDSIVLKGVAGTRAT
jgi:hypothetical protein